LGVGVRVRGLTATSDLELQSQESCGHDPKGQGQRSLGSKVRVETDGRTSYASGQTDRQTDIFIAIPSVCLHKTAIGGAYRLAALDSLFQLNDESR